MAEQYATIVTNPEYRQLFRYQLTDLTFRAVALNSPATSIATANEDFIRDCSIHLDSFLRAKGVEAIQRSWRDRAHPEQPVFLIIQKDPLAREANDAEMAFFRQHLVD